MLMPERPSEPGGFLFWDAGTPGRRALLAGVTGENGRGTRVEKITAGVLRCAALPAAGPRRPGEKGESLLALP